MERFKTFSEKLINFYAHRHFVAEDRLSWAIVYICYDEDTEKIPALKIKDSNFYIDVNRDIVMEKIPEGHDFIWFDMEDAWFSEADKNLSHSFKSGKVVSVDLDCGSYKDVNSCGVVFDYDLEYKPNMSVKGTKEEVYTLDLYSYKYQISKDRLRWGVIELHHSDGCTVNLPILRISDNDDVIITLDCNCFRNIKGRFVFMGYHECYLHDAELVNHTLEFTNSMGESDCYDLEKFLILEQYEYRDFITDYK